MQLSQRTVHAGFPQWELLFSTKNEHVCAYWFMQDTATSHHYKASKYMQDITIGYQHLWITKLPEAPDPWCSGCEVTYKKKSALSVLHIPTSKNHHRNRTYMSRPGQARHTWHISTTLAKPKFLLKHPIGP